MTTPVILYVDDDKDDCNLLKESFATISTSLVCASGGEEALVYLNSVSGEHLPSLIILDLNMPRWDGRQTLHYIKSTPRLAKIPVVILSTSDNKIDKEVCSRLGAASYLQKTYHFDGYSQIVEICMPYLHLSSEANSYSYINS